MPQSFPLEESQLTAMVLGYKNEDSVADVLSPRVKVDSRLFAYHKAPEAENFEITDTRIGNGGFPNQITSSFTKALDEVSDHALEETITVTDINNAPKGVDLRTRSINLLNQYMLNGREKEVLDFYKTASNYGHNISAGSDTWAKEDTDIKGQLDDLLSKTLVRPNTLVLSAKEWLKLRNNKSIKGAISGVAGQATHQQIKDLLEIENIVVPRMRLNSAKKGKDASIVDMFGNTVSAVYLGKNPSTEDTLSFTYTATMDKGQMNYDDDRPGTKGARVVKVFDERKILSVGKKSGAIIINA